MRKVYSLLLVFVVLFGTLNINFATEVEQNNGDQLDLEPNYESAYNVLNVDLEEKVIYVFDTNEPFYIWFSSTRGSKILDGFGNELGGQFSSRQAKEVVVTHFHNADLIDTSFEVKYVQPFVWEKSTNRFAFNHNGTAMINTKSDVTYGEFLKLIEIGKDVDVYYESEDGRRLADLSKERIIQFPNMIRFEHEGHVLKPRFEFDIDVAYNGYYGVPDNTYYTFIPQLEDLSKDQVAAKILNENPYISTVFYHQDTFVANTKSGGTKYLMLVDIESENFKKVDDEKMKSYFYDFSDTYSLRNNKLIRSIDQKDNVVYGLAPGTTLQEFVDAFKLKNGFAFRFYDRASKREIVDYQRPLKSSIAMTTVLTDGVHEQVFELSFDLPVKSLDEEKIKVVDDYLESYVSPMDSMSSFILSMGESKNSSIAYTYGDWNGETRGNIWGYEELDGMIRYFKKNEYGSVLGYYNGGMKEGIDFNNAFNIQSWNHNGAFLLDGTKTNDKAIKAINDVSKAWNKVLDQGNDKASRNAYRYIIQPVSLSISLNKDDEVFSQAKHHYESLLKKLILNGGNEAVVRSYINQLSALSRLDVENASERAQEMMKMTFDMFLKYNKVVDLSEGLTTDFRMSALNGHTIMSDLKTRNNMTEEMLKGASKLLNAKVEKDAEVTPKMLSIISGLALHLLNDDVEMTISSEDLGSYSENGLSISYDEAKKVFTFKDLVTKEIIVFEENK